MYREFTELLIDTPMIIHTWGKSALSEKIPTGTGISINMTCIESLCLKNKLLYQLTSDEWFIPSAIQDKKEIERIKMFERSYYNSALQYLYRFAPPSEGL